MSQGNDAMRTYQEMPAEPRELSAVEDRGRRPLAARPVAAEGHLRGDQRRQRPQRHRRHPSRNIM